MNWIRITELWEYYQYEKERNTPWGKIPFIGYVRNSIDMRIKHFGKAGIVHRNGTIFTFEKKVK